MQDFDFELDSHQTPTNGHSLNKPGSLLTTHSDHHPQDSSNISNHQAKVNNLISSCSLSSSLSSSSSSTSTSSIANNNDAKNGNGASVAPLATISEICNYNSANPAPVNNSSDDQLDQIHFSKEFALIKQQSSSPVEVNQKSTSYKKGSVCSLNANANSNGVNSSGKKNQTEKKVCPIGFLFILHIILESLKVNLEFIQLGFLF
jgi:hypothetical protein